MAKKDRTGNRQPRGQNRHYRIPSVVMFVTMCACCLAFSVVWTLAAAVVLIPNYIFSVKYAKIRYELEKRQHNRMMRRDYLYSLFFTKNDSHYVGKEFARDGIILSGGQRQKLALARALYRNADMIMLDEPSSSFDPESEYHMMSL